MGKLFRNKIDCKFVFFVSSFQNIESDCFNKRKMKEVLISLTICLLIIDSIAAPQYSSQDDGTTNPRHPYQYKYEVKDESQQLFFDKNELGDENGMV